MDDRTPTNSLGRNFTLLLVAYCLFFFGLSLVGGRPLTMHEAVLPETSREMALDHDWIIPKNGGRPWMENPPLPQWITVGIGTLLGGCDRVWVTRIGPALAALMAVWLTANMAAGWFGRNIGLLSGLILATTYEFTQYAWLAEDEIFLCAICTLAVHAFVRIEFFRGDSARAGSRNPFAGRPLSLLWLCVALGMTNFAKGILFGAVMAGVPMVAFLLWNLDFRRITFYTWFWGLLVFVAIMAAWPLAAMWRLPEVVDLWHYDHVGRLDGSYVDITEPWWYYLKVLPTNLAPWIALVPLGLALSWKSASTERYSPERFLWCWAILPIVVFSIPSGKHHHYLLHCTAPWAVLVAKSLGWLHARIQAWPARMRNPYNSLLTLALPGEVALIALGSKIVGPSWLVPALLVGWPLLAFGFSWCTSHSRPAVAAGGLLATVTFGFGCGHLYAAKYADQCIQDTVFLQSIPQAVPAGEPLLVNADLKCLDEFRIQFYLGNRSKVLHNLTFLGDDTLPTTVYLVSRAEHLDQLSEYGEVEQLSQSARSRREKSTGSRLTLFRLRLRDDLPRYSTVGVHVTPMQSQSREPGPFLGRTSVETLVR